MIALILSLALLRFEAQAQFGVPQGVMKPIGYFVMTSSVYTGALGGMAGAKASCEVQLDINTWRGKQAALLTGPLSGPRVRAFLCDDTTCTSLIPNTLYAFARAGSDSSGGALMRTDGAGAGPQDAAMWSTAAYFDSTDQYWTGRAPGTTIAWGTASGNACSSWVGGLFGTYGIPGANGSTRWSNATIGCGTTRRLICIVDP